MGLNEFVGKSWLGVLRKMDGFQDTFRSQFDAVGTIYSEMKIEVRESDYYSTERNIVMIIIRIP